MIGTSYDHIFKKFKESFAPKIESQLVEMADIDAAIVKARGLVLLSKSELLYDASSLVLAHTANTEDLASFNGET